MTENTSESRDALPGRDDEQCPDCEMPECVGSQDDETKAARDPSGALLDICESCLDDGWAEVVEVLE